MAEAFTSYIDDAEAIENGILWTVEKEPSHLCKVKTDEAYRKKIVHQIIDSSNYFNLPPLLITGMMYRESVFRTTEIGPGGELGLMQVGDMGRRSCKEYCGEMKTIKEQVDCGTCWLDKGREWCGSLEGGLSAYICGKCKTKYRRSERAFNIRMNLWNKMKEMHNEI